MMNNAESKTWTLNSLQEYANRYLVGGMSSSFRGNPYTSLPMYLSKAEGAYLYDITGKYVIDASKPVALNASRSVMLFI